MNNDYFILERSADGINFSGIAQVDGSGNSSTLKTYSALDPEAGGTVYYRLKQVDFDGQFEYSRIVSVTCKKSGLDVTTLMPVPSDEYVDVYYSVDKEDGITFIVTDAIGNEVLVENDFAKEGGNIHRIDLSTIARGMYFLTVRSSSDSFVGKLIKK